MRLGIGSFASPLGDILLVTDGEGALRALDFHDHEARMLRLLRLHYGMVELDAGAAPTPLTEALRAYFAGDFPALRDVPVTTGGSDFQRRVWAGLRGILPGTTTSYGKLATAIGKPGAARAVGLANGANPRRHRRSVPPRDRRQFVAHRLRRRAASQALASRSRERARSGAAARFRLKISSRAMLAAS